MMMNFLLGRGGGSKLWVRNRLQNSPYFCLFKYWREQLNKSSETRLKTESETGFFSRACEARELRARKTLTSRFTDFFTDFEKKNRLFCSLGQKGLLNFFWQITCLVLWQKCNACVIEKFRQLNRYIRSGVNVRISVSNERQVWRGGGDPPPRTATGTSGPCSEAD